MDSHGFGRLILGLFGLLVACNTGEADGDGSGGGDATTTMSTATETTPTTTNATDNDSLGTMGGSMGQPDSSGTMGASATDTDDPSATTSVFDMGEPDAPPPMEGCGGVDFLFVIDNSSSMEAQQTQLLASFPAFIASIEASLDAAVGSFHVGVVTSDDYMNNEPGCTSLGDLVTQTGGAGSSNQDCAPLLTAPNRFATEMDDLTMAFQCMAQVGTSGSGIERPVTAAIDALDPANNMPGQCNGGFLRDDAILVVVVITDDPPSLPDMDDAHPGADTSMWYDDIIAAKNGDPGAVVVLGFVPWDDVSCVFGGVESPNLIDFVQSFGDQGVLASICEGDFGPTFTDAVSAIVTTCEDFEPS